MIFSRIISSIIIYFEFSHNIDDALLQFVDFYIFKVITIGSKCGHKKASNVRSFVSSLESIFESAPQLLLTMYVLFNSKSNVDGIVIFSLHHYYQLHIVQ